MSQVVPRLSGEGWRRRAETALYEAALASYRAALEAADPRRLVASSLRVDGGYLRVGKEKFDLSTYKRLMVIGGGKASGAMAEEVEKTLGSRITSGTVNVPPGGLSRTRIVRLHPSSHPVPDRNGLAGVGEILKLADGAREDDLFICLFSGGGSAILPSPVEGLGLEDVQETTRLLLKSGATIDEMNAVRKHLSSVTGGRLAQRMYPATVVSLIISDVIGDRLDSVASGPTAPDPTTYGEAERVLKDYGIWLNVPAGVRRMIEKGSKGSIEETPKPGSKWFLKVHNVIIGRNGLARKAASASLRSAGFRVVEVKKPQVGAAKKVGRKFAEALGRYEPRGRPVALVAGGETTVAVGGRGRGGRNQEFALSAALAIDSASRMCIGAFATDGVDGPTRAAGAIADQTTISRARGLGLDAEASLRNNDSNTFFERLGDAVLTGPTGTNVNDIFVGLKSPLKTSIT